jgi:hypothetical protein
MTAIKLESLYQLGLDDRQISIYQAGRVLAVGEGGDEAEFAARE